MSSVRVPSWPPLFRLGAGVFASALILVAVGSAVGTPLIAAPLMATAVLKHTSPDSPAAAPRRVLGGHLIGALAGVAVVPLLGSGAFALAVAATLAAVAMLRLDVLHAPGAATAYVAVEQHANLWFPLQVVLAGTAVLIATTALLSPLLHGHRYPARRPATQVTVEPAAVVV